MFPVRDRTQSGFQPKREKKQGKRTRPWGGFHKIEELIELIPNWKSTPWLGMIMHLMDRGSEKRKVQCQDGAFSCSLSPLLWKGKTDPKCCCLQCSCSMQATVNDALSTTVVNSFANSFALRLEFAGSDIFLFLWDFSSLQCK